METRDNARLNPEAGKSEPWCRDDFEQVIAIFHEVREYLSYCDVFPDMLLHAIQTVASHDKPDLECSKPSSERDLPITVVRYQPRIGMLVLQIAWSDAQSLREIVSILYKEAAGVEVDQ